MRLRRRRVEKPGGRGPLTGRPLPRLTLALLLAGVLGFCLALAVHIGARSLAGAEGPVVMFKNPQDPTLWLCDESVAACNGDGRGHLTINEEVSGIPSGVGLGSFEFLIYYWGNIVNVSVAEGPFLGSTGRATSCSTVEGENWLRFGCVSVGSEPGPSGSGVLAYIEVEPNPDLVLRPTAGNGIFTRLLDSRFDAELANEAGDPIPVEEVGSADILLAALEGDVNYDCRVNVIDEQAVSVRYGTTFGIQPYDTFFDLEPIFADSDIDIKDLQFVYGRDGTTCEGQEPPGTATPTPTEGTPGTATPTPTEGTPGTPGATPTAGTPSPSATAPPSGKRTKTPTPVASPTPTGSPAPGTATPAPSGPSGALTPTPESGAVPIEMTPGPGGEIVPEERTPGAEELPRAGVGPRGGSSDGRLLLLIAAVVVGGWSVLAGMLYRRGTLPSEQPVRGRAARHRPSRRS